MIHQVETCAQREVKVPQDPKINQPCREKKTKKMVTNLRRKENNFLILSLRFNVALTPPAPLLLLLKKRKE